MPLLQSIKNFLKSYKKSIFILIAALSILSSLFIITLEILSGKCPKIVRSERPSCSELIKKYVPDSHDYEPLDPANFLPGKPKNYDLEKIIAERVFKIDPKDLLGLNGIACSPYAFIANNLPWRAKRYVAIHEALHLVGYDNETEVNFKAGLKEPIGLVLTVIHSVLSNLKGHGVGEYPCIFGNLWGTFKKYFFNVTPNPNYGIP